MDKNVEIIKILLFEDNLGDAGLIEMMLEDFTNFSYELKNVETLDEGLNTIKERPFDVILLDLGLPDSDGIDTFLDVHRKSPGIPIIILTGLTDEKTGITAVKKGAQDYLVKGQVKSELLERSIIYSIERKKSEEKIQRLANIVESSDDAIISKTLEGVITSWNKGAERIYGYSVEEILGKSVSILETNNLKGETKQLIERVKQGKRIHHYETLRLKRDDTIINISITLSPVFDTSGELVAISTIARDITERKKAEKELELANRYNRSLIEASLDPLVTIDPDGKITDVNYSTELVTGYSRNELIGTYFSDYFTEPRKAKDGYKQVFREGKVRDYELEIRHKNGHLTPVLYNASAYRDESGEVIGIFAAARDITGMKQAKDKLKVIIDELKRSNDELRSFAFITSHDLQEPLRTMGSYAGLLKRRYEGKLDSDADEFIEYMVSGALRMQDMIRGLLDYSRVGTQGDEFKEFSTEKALKSAISNLKSSIEECNAEITYDSLPVVFADENQIERMFQNLISNSLKFCRDGVPPKIHVSARKEGSEYVLNVQDNGIGIEEQYTGRIFEVFKRLHAIGEYEGAGIGLAIVKRIVERHDGYIWVESEFGEGSAFYFTIPDGRK